MHVKQLGSVISTLISRLGFEFPWGKLATSTLSRSFYFEFPATGQAVIPTTACPVDIRNQFINHPTIAPDASCIAKIKGPAFVTEVYLNSGVYKVATGMQHPNPLLLDVLGLDWLNLLSAVIGLPLADWRVRGNPGPSEPFANKARWLVSMTSALNLIFVFRIALFIGNALDANYYTLLFGLPSSATPLFAIPWLTAITTTALIIVAALA